MRLTATVIPLLLAASATVRTVAQLPAAPGPDAVGGWASDRVLVKLASGASVARAQDGTIVARDVRGAALGGLQAALGAVGATNATRASTVAPANAARARAVGLDRWFEVSLPAGSDAAGAAARLGTEAGVEVAEVVGIGGIAADAPAPSDPGYPLQWALENVGQSINGVAGSAGSDIGARAAWHVTTGRPTTVIAVLDSGLDAHADYADRLLPGRNIPAGNADTSDQCASHGTHCAGIAAARGNDGVGIAGLDWNARILPVTVLSGCSGFTSWLADGVIWAADNGADVMNLSLQYSVENQYLRDAIAYAMQGGSVIVAAAGNTGTAGVAVPARWPEVIAVLDSGLDAHADYADRLLPGRNIPAGNTDTSDQCGSHGTHCAGIAAARGNDGIGIAGLDWNARILPVTVLSGCSGFTSWLADGVIWAADNGADVMNLSLQYSVENQYLRDAIAYAMQGGSVIVAAAGNTGTAGVAVPARWPEVIAVASLNSIDSAAPSSAVGPQLDFAAPGVAIYSCVGAAQLDFKSGTSMAAPHVAGTIALMRGIAPGLAPAQLEALVRQSCVDVMNAGFDNWSGWGRIDAGAAVRLARAAVAGDLTGDERVDGADLGTMLGAWGTGGYDCLADFDDDGTVGGSDLGVLLGAWGTGY